MKKKIIINNNITIYDSPSDGIPYISDVKIVEAVSNNKGIEIGGTAANKLSFRLFNPPMEHLDGAKIEVFIQDIAEVDEVLETLINLETDTIDTDLVTQDIVSDVDNNNTDTAADSDDIAGFLEGYDTTVETIDTNAGANTYDPSDADEDDETITPAEVTQETRDDETDDATEAEAAENMDDSWQAMGTFYVTKVKSDKSNELITVTALDGFGVMNGYFEPTDASATLDNSYADFKTQLAGIGLIAEDETFPTDSSFAIKKMKFRDAVATFAGLAGGYGNFNRYGTLDLRRYKINDSYLIGEAEIHSVNTTDDEFIVDSVLCGDPNGSNLISPAGGVYGDGTLIFENDYMTQDILDGIKTAYEDLHWQPCEIVCAWHYGMTAGDIVKAKIGDEFSYISISYIEIDLDTETCKIKSFGESSTKHIKKTERGSTSISKNTVAKALKNPDIQTLIKEISGTGGDDYMLFGPSIDYSSNKTYYDLKNGNDAVMRKDITILRFGKIGVEFGEATFKAGAKYLDLDSTKDGILAYQADAASGTNFRVVPKVFVNTANGNELSALNCIYSGRMRSQTNLRLYRTPIDGTDISNLPAEDVQFLVIGIFHKS